MVISSLLNLQSGSITDDTTRAAVKESQSRVKSMALIHQLLYQSDRFTIIDFPKYLEQLMSSLQSTYGNQSVEISYKVSSDEIKIDIDTAVPLGLITNELATNAYKYAFTEQSKGNIDIHFSRSAAHQYTLKIADDGKGMPENFDPAKSTTLGLKLVYILARQIKAKINYHSETGTEFNIIFAEHV
jgi:two-component sensor histidine kinase